MDLAGQHEFAVRLTQELAHRPGNLFASPFSAWYLLALLHPGARGKTRDALSRVLGLPTGDQGENWIKAVKDLTLGLKEPRPRTLESKDQPESFRLILANALWLQQGYLLEPGYLKRIRDSFEAQVEELDLTGEPIAACGAVNRWADQTTRGKIRDVLSPDEIHPLTRLILSNATYFKDNWDEKFDFEKTRSEPFHCLDGSTVRVPTMHQTTGFHYFKDRRVQAVRLPYAHARLSMIVILPKQIRKFEASLTPKSLARLFDSLDRLSLVDLALPRCRLEGEFGLVPSLKVMGLGSLFNESADLTGISPEPELFVGQVKQVTFVEVDEQGTEAAAVTVSHEQATASLEERKPKVEHMIVDHPYWFFIRDDRSGCLLFAGRVEDPS